jgi:hypothetical protein
MLLLAVLETFTFKGMKSPPLRISPARGVDFPDLNLGVKSPSENWYTSEPYFSAYERILGSDHDVLVLITDYQESKKTSPLRLQIKYWKYLRRTQVADRTLCRIALKQRARLIADDEGRAKRVVRFLVHVNQMDWRAKRILELVEHMGDATKIPDLISKAEKDFEKTNRGRLKKGEIPIPESDIQVLRNILMVQPLHVGIVDAADNWVIEVLKQSALAPSETEWSTFLTSPLNGLIGVSLALQWRYNFKHLFGKTIQGEFK